MVNLRVAEFYASRYAYAGGYMMQIYPVVIANVQMDSFTGLFSILGFSALFFHSATGAFFAPLLRGTARAAV